MFSRVSGKADEGSLAVIRLHWFYLKTLVLTCFNLLGFRVDGLNELLCYARFILG